MRNKLRSREIYGYLGDGTGRDAFFVFENPLIIVANSGVDRVYGIPTDQGLGFLGGFKINFGAVPSSKETKFDFKKLIFQENCSP